MAAIEALTNAAIGLVLSWSATFFVLGFDPVQSAAITAMFFALSFMRSYLLRLLFRSFSNG